MIRRISILLAAVFLCRCGEEAPPPVLNTDPHQQYEDEQVTVLGGDDTTPIATAPVGMNDCLQITEQRTQTRGTGPLES